MIKTRLARAGGRGFCQEPRGLRGVLVFNVEHRRQLGEYLRQ